MTVLYPLGGFLIAFHNQRVQFFCGGMLSVITSQYSEHYYYAEYAVSKVPGMEFNTMETPVSSG